MTMTFDPTGPGSRVKVLELISAYGDEEFTVYGRHWLVTLVIVLLQDKVRPKHSCWLVVAVVTMVTGNVSNPAVIEERTVKQCF